MGFYNIIRRPEYAQRPRQLWRRLRRTSLLARHEVRLAWDLPVEVETTSHIGEDIINIGVFDRIIPECICRLLDPGEEAFDIGANVGQNVSMMALASGGRGRAVAFEPNPQALRILDHNIKCWARYDIEPITLMRKGASSHTGTGHLYECVDLGGFSLERDAPGILKQSEGEILGFDIELIALDDFAAGDTPIGLIKIDVEGHELSVLQGAKRLLHDKRIRDVVFEDFQLQPSPVTKLLEAAGYTVFALFSHWRKPGLVRLRECIGRRLPQHHAPNFLATCDPDRAISRFQENGWRCLHLNALLRS